MKNLKNNYRVLIQALEVATESYLKNDIKDCSIQLKESTLLIDDFIKNSKNISKTAFDVENICLQHDASVNFSISKGNSVTNIDSRIQGCKSALSDLKQLQNNPKEFYLDNNTTFRTINENANTAYTKEIFNSLRYLSNRKNTINLSAMSEVAFKFYEKRQEILRLGKTAFLEEKQLYSKQFKIQSNENKQDKIKNKGLQR